MPSQAMENIAPPEPSYTDASPKDGSDRSLIIPDSKLLTADYGKDIALAAAQYKDGCAGGDTFENNCAHYLSNAFILAGATDLAASHSCIEARCGSPSKRPIRARDMKCWFSKKATKTSRVMIKNSGFWAVFQLDESAYWGGHVAIIDSNDWKFYGTGWYDEWDQYWYQW